MLRLCRIYIGKNDNVSKNNFELLMSRCDADYSNYRVNSGKPEYFVALGNLAGELTIPKLMYDSDGNLSFYPIEGQHLIPLRTKSQRGSVPRLLDHVATNKKDSGDRIKPNAGTKQIDDISPKGLLLSFLSELVMDAAKTGEAKLSKRSQRKLTRLIDAAVDVEARDLLHAALSKLAFGKMEAMETAKDSVRSPDKPSSSVQVISPTTATPPTAAGPRTCKEGVTVDLLEEEDEEEPESPSSMDEFIAELQEEVLLQSLLHRRVLEKKERVFTLEHKNGRRLLVVLPPDTQSAAAFQEEARRTCWVETMLNTEERQKGMLTHLARTIPHHYTDVGQKRKLSMQPVVLSTAQTLALARVSNLNDMRMKQMRSFIRNVGGVQLQLSAKEVIRIDKEVGLDRTVATATFGSYLQEWSQTKGKEKKPPEEVLYWHAALSNEIEAEVDLYLAHYFLQRETSFSIPLIDYRADGFATAGVTVLIGGDHGDKNCPISAKINLASPAERKRRNELNYQCPMVVFASIQCTKDTYGLLNSTVMPAVKKEIQNLENNAIVTVYHRKNIKCYRSFMVPASINLSTVAFRNTEEGNDLTMTYAYASDNVISFGSLPLKEPFMDIPYFELGFKRVISRFNVLFIGDLAFLAMLLGMSGSSGAHCLLCDAKAAEFNCQQHPMSLRTKESLAECLQQHSSNTANSNRKNPPANYKGVNCSPLCDIDPKRIIIPVLHCPLGLVDKVLESFKAWVNLEAENLNDVPASETIRSLYRLATQVHQSAIIAHEQAKALALADPTNEAAQKLQVETNKGRIQAKKEESKAKERYDDMIQRHNAKKTSLNQAFETIFSIMGIKREHYHGGKFNGVNCIRIMEKATQLFVGDSVSQSPSFQSKILENRAPSITEDAVASKCADFAKLMGILDAIWSSVRGIECGLLPSNQQLQLLERAVTEGKQQWLKMKLSTQQPKWHLTFDGYLMQQVQLYGGLADKADDSIEKFHQTLKGLRDRFRGTRSYEMKETCIHRELRRQRSAEIRQEVEAFEAKIKQSSGTKRKKEALERQKEKSEAKKAKREAFVSP